MKRFANILMLIAVGVVQQSCFFQKEEESTVVKGILTNQITGEAIGGVHFEVGSVQEASRLHQSAILSQQLLQMLLELMN